MLLERSTQSQRLLRSFQDAEHGHGRVAALLGEAGVGKTSLVESFARDVASRARVLRSSCEDLAISDPLSPLRDLAREADAALSQDPREASPVHLFSQALRIFAEGDRPTVMVVEDIHWADDATLDFIRFIGRRVSRTRILMILTSRNESTESRKRVRRALADIATNVLVRIEVPLLSLEAVAELARDARVDPQALHKATGGNAFLVTEAVLSGSVETTPAAIEDSVLVRADRLGPAAREALELVSVFPGRAETTLVEATLGPGARGALDDGVDLGLIVEAGVFVQFRHEMARRVVERSLGAARRRDLNGRVLATLEARGDAAAARLVHHAREAGRFDLIHAIAPGAAAAASKVGAHREAASILATSLDSPGSEALPDRARLLTDLAVELYLTGRITEAMQRLEGALRLRRQAGDRLGEGDGLRWMSRLSYLAGDRISAERYGAAALACFEGQPDSAELAMAHSNLSQLAMLADRIEPALAHGTRAADIARRLGRPDIISHALNNMGTVQQWTDPVGAERDLTAALDLARRHDLQEHAARAYTNLGWMLVIRRDHAAAARVLEEGIAYSTDRDLDTWRDYMFAWQAELLLRTGLWDDAAECARKVLDNPTAPPLARYPACVALARLRVRRGDPVEALVQEIEAYLLTGRELQRLAQYALFLAERAWITGQHREAAVACLREVVGLMPNASLYHDVFLWISVLSPDADAGSADRAVPDPSDDMPFERAVLLAHRPGGGREQAATLMEGLQARAVLARLGGRGQDRSSASSRRPDDLTPRELDILAHLNRGLSNKAIARQLGISPKTVDHHVSSVIAKLAATSRAHAAAVAREKGLL